MDTRSPPEPDAELLPEPMAARLLARASELDAARRSGVAVNDLRAAAAEAGISSYAFEAALTELRGDEPARVPELRAQPRRRSRRWGLTAGLAGMIAVGALYVGQRLVPAGSAAVPAPLVEEAFLLRCLSPGDAAELIRPLALPTVEAVVAAGRDSRVLTIRATPGELEKVREVIEQYERAEACTR